MRTQSVTWNERRQRCEQAIAMLTEIEVRMPPCFNRGLKGFPPRLLCRKAAPVVYW